MSIKLDKITISAWTKLIRTQQWLLECTESDLKAEKFPPLSWYDVLLELDRNDNGKLRISDLGMEVLLSKSNITRLIDRMETKNLIIRERCKEDGRGAYAIITQKGRNLKKRMWPVYEKAITHYFSDKLTEKDKKNLEIILSKLLN